MLLKKPRLIALALAGLVVVIIAVIVWINWGDGDRLDYRKFFSNRAAMTKSGCFVIAPKPVKRPNGTFYFLHSTARQSNSGASPSTLGPSPLQIMRFRFDEWQLDKVAELPTPPNTSVAFIRSSDWEGENFILQFRHFAFASVTTTYTLFSARRETNHVLARQTDCVILGNEAIGIYEDATTTPRMCRTDANTMQTNPWVPPLDLETSCITGYFTPYVVNPKNGPLYFAIEYLDSGTTQSRIYRCDHPDAKPVSVASYPAPFQIATPGGRYPFDYLTEALRYREHTLPLINMRIKIPYTETYRKADMKPGFIGCIQTDLIHTDWEIWSGAIKQWNENQRDFNMHSGRALNRSFDPAGLSDLRRLARFRISDNLGGFSAAVSPDSRYVIFAQALLKSYIACEEALMAIDINTGACTPILLHENSDHTDTVINSFVYQ